MTNHEHISIYPYLKIFTNKKLLLLLLDLVFRKVRPERLQNVNL